MANNNRRISNAVVDAMKPGDKPIWDAEVKGFGVRCQGRSKVYMLKYRIGGRQRWYTIGTHGSPWTPKQARQRALKLLGSVADGKDPAETRDVEKADLSVSALCDEYLREGCTIKKQSTIEDDRGRIERHIKPLLGRKRVLQVTRSDVVRMMRDIAKKRGRAIVKGGKGTANRTVHLLGAIFTYAVDGGHCDTNPVRGVKFFPSARKERFLSSAELSRLGAALSEAEERGINSTALNAIRLLALTGCRKSEILSLEWSFVDFEHGHLRLPDSKTGAKVIPVGLPALELLAALPHSSGNPFVFPGSVGGQHFVGLPKVWRKIRSMADIEDVRLHDLRHSFASVAASGKESLLVIGRLLGHSRAATTQRYAHLADDPLQSAADRISSKISSAMNKDRAVVVDIFEQKT
jgi:integrase